MRIIILILITIMGVSLLHAETVYKTVDAEGNVVFSDSPSEGAEKIEVKKAPAISLPVPDYEYSSAKTEQTNIGYSVLNIINPQNDMTIHNNQGNVMVDFEIQPDLKYGDKIVLFLDGKETMTGNATPLELNNIDRGTHSIALAVINQAGETVKQSNKVIYHLRRVSVLTTGNKPNVISGPPISNSAEPNLPQPLP